MDKDFQATIGGVQMQLSTELLSMALVGYELQRDQIIATMSELKQMIGRSEGQAIGRSAIVTDENALFDGAWSLLKNIGPHRRTMSAAARKRIGAAQKARWDTYRREKVMRAA